jgi:hypothetical protein
MDEPKKFLTRGEILAVDDIHYEDVPVPEWGGVVRVKTLSSEARDSLESQMVEFTPEGKPKKIHLSKTRAIIGSLSMCDEDGNLLFTEKDVKYLGLKSSSALERVVKVAQKLSKMEDTAVEKMADDLKNDPPGDSPSDSLLD